MNANVECALVDRLNCTVKQGNDAVTICLSTPSHYDIRSTSVSKTSKDFSKNLTLLFEKDVFKWDTQLKITFSRKGTSAGKKLVTARLQGSLIDHLYRLLGSSLRLSLISAFSSSPEPLTKKPRGLQEPGDQGCYAIRCINFLDLAPKVSDSQHVMFEYTEEEEREDWDKDFATQMGVCDNLGIDIKGVLWEPPLVSDFNKKLLKEQIDTDVIIETETGEEIGCHKLFLTASSPVMKTMFENKNFKEGATQRIQLNNMSEAGINSLLSFFYYHDIEAGKDNFDIAMELLNASEEYDIPLLKEVLKFTLLQKSDCWFTDSDAVMLFCHSRRLENCRELKDKSLRMLRRKSPTFKRTPEYKEMLTNDKDAAYELLDYFID